MREFFARMTILALIGALLDLTGSQARSSDKTAQLKPALVPGEYDKFFVSEVHPILKANCFACHGGQHKVKAGLRLTSREMILKGGESGPAIRLDHPEESLLLQAVNYQDLKMPPKGKLSQRQIEILTRWVKLGAPWPVRSSLSPEKGDNAAKRQGPPPVDEQAKQFWAFRPVTRPALPAVKKTEWIRNSIDRFVLAKLEAAGLEPAPPAERGALLRRVTYDLIGLPPSSEEVDAFLADDSPDAYEKVIDRLLASPHYGEHWGRHWLDLVRYAETNSFERDGAKPNAWRYRDYVIRSVNEDKPYDQFIREQLAGDEQEKRTAESLIATGYYRLGQWDDEPADPVQALYDELDDILATTGQVFLGLTVNCARCHDHKIDPFPQKDYYRLLAFFQGINRYGERSPDSVAKASLRPIAVPIDQAEQREEVEAHKKQLRAVREQMKVIEDAVIPRLEGGERDDFKHEANRLAIFRKHVPDLFSQESLNRYLALRRGLRSLERKKPSALAEALCVTEIGRTPRETFVLLRGNPQAKGDKVDPGFPSVLTAAVPAAPQPGPDGKTSGRRRVLADWIASAENPLTARVVVNRLWQYHFGRGIVRSSSNFGYQGTPPTHPELLDWLASEFVAASPHSVSPEGRDVGVRAWKLKAMHKLLLMSNTYRMSSQPNAAALAKDPENDLYWRFDPRRLAAEEVRDSILAVCGNLNHQKIGGPSVYPMIPREVLAGQSMPGAGWGSSPADDQNRRSVYIHVKRSLAVPLLTAFDAPDTDASCPVRFTTTQPTQALAMLNSDFVNEQAKVLALDLRLRAGADPAAQVRLALRRTLQRQPSATEIERGVKFMQKMHAEHRCTPEEALHSFCLLVLNLNEFIYLD